MKIIRRLADIPGDLKCAIYGAGQAGTVFLKILREFKPGTTVDYFIDSWKSGHKEGLPILSLKEFLARDHKTNDTLVLIASSKWREIETSLKENQLDNYLIIPRRFLFPSPYERLCRSKKHHPCDNPLYQALFRESDRELYKDELKKVTELLSHPEDKALYRVLSGDYQGYENNLDGITDFYYRGPFEHCYFNFINYAYVNIMIEGGVCDGSDTMLFLDRMNPGGWIYGFEPNYELFARGPYKGPLSAAPRIKIIPMGLWSQKSRLFITDNWAYSKIISNPGSGQAPPNSFPIDTISIDQFVKEEGVGKVDFIKMDVEGAELEALTGAVETLKRDRPQLAICIYHQKEDFFRIPLFLNETLEHYTHRIGHYTAGSSETVWYAIPDELENSKTGGLEK